MNEGLPLPEPAGRPEGVVPEDRRGSPHQSAIMMSQQLIAHL